MATPRMHGPHTPPAMRGAVLSSLALALMCGCGGGSSPSSDPSVTRSASSPAAGTPTGLISPTASSPSPLVHFPPATRDELAILSATGVTSDVVIVKTVDQATTGVCAHYVFVTVTLSAGLPPVQQFADIAKVFLARHLDQGCGGAVLGYYDPARAASDARSDVGISLFTASTPNSIKLAPINDDVVTIPLP